MARLARTVVPGLPHHVTQRGNGRQQTFFTDDDYRLYRRLLGEACRDHGVGVWAWVLMPNHVHLVLAPETAEGLSRALARVHRAHAGAVHARLQRTGHFWQGRFGAVALDEPHVAATLRYVYLNPVRARLVERAAEWPWSSLHAHRGAADGVTDTGPVEARFPGLAGLLEADETDAAAHKALRRAESIGRPLGDAAFLAAIESRLGRVVSPRKRGPKPKEASAPGR
ncbi:MAG: transposase [Alphaproteobacteria bacterium]